MGKWVEWLKAKLVKKEKAPKKKVFSLAAGVEDIPDEYAVYKEYLDAAMADLTIRNIAITGDYGIGKSSFLKWFAQGKRYLFVSLCDFNREENKKNVKETCCDIYRQLMIGCSRARKAKEKWKKGFFYCVTWVAVSLAVFYLLLNNTFGCMDWVMEIHREAGLKLYRLFHWYATDAEMALQKAAVEQKFVANVVIANMKKWKFAADGFVGIAGLIATVMIPRGLCILLSSLKLTFKTKIEETEVGAELELKKTDYSHYVDQLKVKLIDLLRREKKNYQSVIIFEDFDRFPYPVCRYLLNDLHDINRLLNYSIGTTEKNPIRFIYVLKDDLFAFDPTNCEDSIHKVAQQQCDAQAQKEKAEKSEYASAVEVSTHKMKEGIVQLAEKKQQLKLFDYILPIIPGIYCYASARYIDDCLRRVGVYEQVIAEFICVVAEHLYDYRTIGSVVNEYQIIRDVYMKKTGAEMDWLYEYSALALAVYKTLMPENYARIREGTSILHHSEMDISEDDIIDPCVYALWKEKWLDAQCLSLAGFDELAMKQYALKLVAGSKHNHPKTEHCRSWIENTYHYWHIEFLYGKTDGSELVVNLPYTMLIMQIKEEGNDLDAWTYFMDKVPFAHLAITCEVSENNISGLVDIERDYPFRRLMKLLSDKSKGYGVIVGYVAAYLLAFGYGNIEEFWRYASLDDFIRWIKWNGQCLLTNEFYARVAERYIGKLESDQLGFLISKVRSYETAQILFSLKIQASLKDRLRKNLTELPMEETPTTDQSPTPQAPSA